MAPAPLHANATRGAHYRAILGSRTYLYLVVFGMSAACVIGAMRNGLAEALLDPAIVLAISQVIAFLIADQRAERDFWTGFANGLGLMYLGDYELMPFTPLLGAGDRRRVEHWMIGPMPGDPDHRKSGLGLYTYEVRQENGDKPDTWVSHDFTITVTELPAAMVLYPAVYVRRRQRMRRLLGHEWLPSDRTEKVELESAAFHERYELRVAQQSDQIQLRELFSPAFLSFLAEHPLEPQFEYSAGTLCVFLDEHHEDAGTLTYMFDVTREIVKRLLAEVEEERAAGRPVISG